MRAGPSWIRLAGASLVATLLALPIFAMLLAIVLTLSSGLDNSFTDFGGPWEFVGGIIAMILFSFIVGPMLFPHLVALAFVLSILSGAYLSGWPDNRFRYHGRKPWLILGGMIGGLVGSYFTFMAYYDGLTGRGWFETFSFIPIGICTGALCMHVWRALMLYWVNNSGYRYGHRDY